jgi:hypothetical protein
VETDAADAILPPKTLGAQLVEAVGQGIKAGTADGVKTLVGAILAYGIALTFKAMGGPGNP